MYSDLFDALGGQGGNAARANNNNNDENTNAPAPVLSFKAGKMEMALQDTGVYTCNPDTRRCQVNLKYNTSNQLEWEWYDRREKKVLESITITDPVKLVKTEVPSASEDNPAHVYYWKLDSEWRMLWLQDKEVPEDLIDKANAILKVPSKNDAATAPSPGNASTSSASTTTRQVDALSNILENLGMPQQQGGTAAAPAPAATGTLTLADLQSAMGGVASNTSSTAPPALNEIVTSDAIKGLLENEEVRARLLEQLPEEQRTPEHLEENLRSPQIQQTLRSLTAALMPDDQGSMDGYHSVLANFQLDASDGQQALASGQSPIQAFLDCVLASVEKEKSEESKDEEMKEE